MSSLYRPLSFLFWLLGLVSIVGAVIWRFAPHRGIHLDVEPRTMLLLAGIFFLGAIASRLMERGSTS
jgi:hypothetical protein